mmetsp:Transcript_28421/g.73139  ORF Transcript_28421/g.73139 Transcript_28421/m.73139 type:complete len:232 (-) Transcript_28421:625-1320(-)
MARMRCAGMQHAGWIGNCILRRPSQSSAAWCICCCICCSCSCSICCSPASSFCGCCRCPSCCPSSVGGGSFFLFLLTCCFPPARPWPPSVPAAAQASSGSGGMSAARLSKLPFVVPPLKGAACTGARPPGSRPKDHRWRPWLPQPSAALPKMASHALQPPPHTPSSSASTCPGIMCCCCCCCCRLARHWATESRQSWRELLGGSCTCCWARCSSLARASSCTCSSHAQLCW